MQNKSKVAWLKCTVQISVIVVVCILRICGIFENDDIYEFESIWSYKDTSLYYQVPPKSVQKFKAKWNEHPVWPQINSKFLKS